MSSTYMIALYIRLSTEDSKVGSFSIENQRRALQQHIDTMEDIRNIETLEFVDNGYSGTNFERPAVQELLDLVRAGKVNCIIVKDFTRFGRNSIEVGYFMEKVFPIYGVRFISLNDNFDSNTLHGDTGGINVAFKYLASEFYSRDLSIKYKSAKYVKFRRGEYQSKICPYGYRKGADGRMEPDEEAAPNVKLIFDLAQKGLGTTQISEELFARGILTPGEYKVSKGQVAYDISRSRRIWQRTTILSILIDARYTGTYIMGKREVTEVGGHKVRVKDESQWIKIPNHHPAIVSPEIFEDVQQQLAHVRSVKRNVSSFPLRGKVICGCCHHVMQRTTAKDHVFLCRYTLVDKDAPCYGLKITETELERMIYEILAKQAQIILNLDSLADASLLDVQSAKLAECSKQIREYMEQKRVLHESLLLKEVSTEVYKSRKAEIDIELNRVKQMQSVVSAQTEKMQMDEKKKCTMTQLAQEISSVSNLTAGLADALIDRVYVFPGNQLEIVWKVKDFCVEQ